MWSQNYFLFGNNLAISALIAAVPIFTLLLLLRHPAQNRLGSPVLPPCRQPGPGGRVPMRSGWRSVLPAHGRCLRPLSISWIVFGRSRSFRLTVDTGKFEIIKESIGRLTSDRRMQALLIAFAFGAFIEGAAVSELPSPSPLRCSPALAFLTARRAICLLANTSPVAFGSNRYPIVTLAGITGLPSITQPPRAALRTCLAVHPLPISCWQSVEFLLCREPGCPLLLPEFPLPDAVPSCQLRRSTN